MGTDNLFHKRKARSIESLKRQAARREPYDVVLIVCEGTKTEPNYFRGIRNELRLSTANIKIVENKSGSAPLSVVDCAIEEFEKSVKDKEPYDRVFCVFDKDKHPTYLEAIDKIRGQRGDFFHAVISVPCFEVWILLHFVYTTKPFEAAGSNCAQVISELKKYFPNYEKNSKIFDTIKHKIGDAVNRAKSLDKYHETSGTDNPSTKVYMLVDYLFSLRASK